MKAQHTAGPWTVYHEGGSMGNGGHWGVEVADGGTIAIMAAKPNDRQQERHNARLIAAAPELLEALKELLRHLHNNPQHTGEYFTTCPEAEEGRAAIARAEGK